MSLFKVFSFIVNTVKLINYLMFYYPSIGFDLLTWTRKLECNHCSVILSIFTERPDLGYDWINLRNFSTFDRDQDELTDGSCAQIYHGAWWYWWDCFNANPNGPYLTPGTTGHPSAMIYWAFRGTMESLRTIKLMFR